jgi:glycosyltransferase involved in cell wall biosynthesis
MGLSPVRVSVVVPTYRRPDLLARCLAALASQRLPADDYEVLVADDAACDATRAQVEEFAAASPVPVRYLAVADSHGPAAARNVGWRAARGEVMALTDDDCVPDPGWLAAGLAAFDADPGLAAAAGRVVVPLPPAPTDYERDAAGLERAEFVTANCFCRKGALARVGGFDERFRAAWREDSDLQFSLLESGHRVGRAGDAVVFHPVRPAPWGVSLRQQRKSQYDALLYKKHAAYYRRHAGATTPWHYYATLAALAAAGGLVLAGRAWPALAATAAWALLTGRFCALRLWGTSHAPRHVAEMALTSVLIPPLSVFWRLYGAARFRVPFL